MVQACEEGLHRKHWAGLWQWAVGYRLGSAQTCARLLDELFTVCISTGFSRRVCLLGLVHETLFCASQSSFTGSGGQHMGMDWCWDRPPAGTGDKSRENQT